MERSLVPHGASRGRLWNLPLLSWPTLGNCFLSVSQFPHLKRDCSICLMGAAKCIIRHHLVEHCVSSCVFSFLGQMGKANRKRRVVLQRSKIGSLPGLEPVSNRGSENFPTWQHAKPKIHNGKFLILSPTTQSLHVFELFSSFSLAIRGSNRLIIEVH